MNIEAFGFEPVHGKEYVVTFTNDGELLSTSVYNGSPLPSVNFPDNAKIGFTVTDKETGKQLMSTDFISYNGKLYKSVFNLPLKDPDSNMNANIYIKDLHYDLTTGSVLVQIQGFQGDEYQLLVSDTTVNHQVLATPVTLQDDMYYSIPTELVQGNEFKVLLQDQHGKAIDDQIFTAPISTDWRYTDTVEDGSLQLDEDGNPVEDETEQDVQDEFVPPLMPGQEQELETQEGQAGSLLPDAIVPYQKPIIFGGIGLTVLLASILIIRMINKRRMRKAWEAGEDDYPEEGIEDWEHDLEDEEESWVPEEAEGDGDEFEEVVDETEELPEEPEPKTKKKKKFGLRRK